jgi:putative tryptophan/tyrosine transport system substrate-binding protein
MRRREFLGTLGVAAAWPLAARAQQPPVVHRIGYLGTSRIPHLIEALHSGLRELGYVEGRNLKVEYRFGGGDESLDVLAAELAALNPDAIVTLGTPAALAAKQVLLARADEVIE